MSSCDQSGVDDMSEAEGNARLEWDTNFIVDLSRKGKLGHSSWIWNHFGTLKNKRTGAEYDNSFAYCKVCVEEAHSLKNK